MKTTFLHRFLLPIAMALIGCSLQQTIAENLMIGFNRVNCPAKSDTFVSVPFMKHPVKASKTLAAAPTLSAGQATLAPAEATAWNANELKGTHYVRFTSGSLAGHWYEVVENATSSLTVDLNGENASGLLQGDAFMVVEFWTLDTLFPPASQTTFHKSSGNLGYQQKSKLLVPDLVSSGINLPAAGIYFLSNDGWKKSEAGYPNAGNTILPPGLPFIIRHPAGVAATDFEPEGRVLRSTDSVALMQAPANRQDNTVSIFRPVDVTLSSAGLDETAFASSSSHESGGRSDELLVFDNAKAAFNKTPSALFYKYSQAWFQDEGKAEANSSAATNAITASGGLIIRKSQGNVSSTFWNNQPNY